MVHLFFMFFFHLPLNIIAINDNIRIQMHEHKSVKIETVKYFSDYTFHMLSYGFTISADLMLGSRLGVGYL